MGSRAPSPHPLATTLLALEERAGSGEVRVGARRLWLQRGKLVDVGRVPGEPSVAEFLRQAGRLDEPTFARVGADAEADRVLASVALPAETLHELVRTVWASRLARSFEDPAAAAELDEGRAAPAAGIEVGLAVLVLDALERAALPEAELIGARANGLVEWNEGALTSRAQRWLGVEGKRARRVSGVLGSRPGSAARLAALVKAGLARVVDDRVLSPSPPAPVEPSLLVPRDSLPEIKPPSLELAPGAAVSARTSIAPRIDVPRFPPATERLEDPLEALELKVGRLEASGAPTAERARAFRALGDGWMRMHGAVEEMARSYREAAALEKHDPDLLVRTAEACAGAGQLDVALAYGRAAVASQATPDGRGATLLWYALFCRRFDRPSDALGAARAAQGTGQAKAETYSLAAELEASHGMHAEAHRDLLEAAAIAQASQPDRAHAWLAEAWLGARTGTATDLSPRVADAFASSLAALGHVDAALAVRADTVRRTRDPEHRRRLLLSLAERAELAERPLVAVDHQLEVLESEPALEVVYDSVNQDLESAGLVVERALVLEDLALRGLSESQVELYVRAVEARLLARMRPEWTLVLVRRALALGAPPPRLRVVLEALRATVGEAPVADVIEEAAYAVPEGSERRLLLDLLLSWGGGIRHGARRLARAMRERQVSAPAALESDVAAEESALASAEARHARASGSARRAAALELAQLLAATAAGRTRAEGLVDEILAEVPNDEAEELALRLALARGDATAILRASSRIGARGGSAEKRQRALSLVLAAAAEKRDLRAARDAAGHLARLEADTQETAVRIRRIGARGADLELEVRGLRGEAALASGESGAAARARSLARLAALALESGSVEQAARAANEALELAPDQGAAALSGLFAIARGQSSLPLVARVKALFGELPVLLAAEARLEPDAARSLAATVRWASLDPTSPEPPIVALEECLARGIDDYLEPGIHALLTDARGVPRAVPTIARALRRLAERGEVARAAELARRAAIFFGATIEGGGAPLRPIALDLGRREADPFHERAALELEVPPREDVPARVAHLARIAAVAREGGDRAAEVRALLRVLGVAPREPDTVARLAHLFAETGRTEQLFATLEHAAEGGEPADTKRALLWLAAAASQVLGSEEKARAYLDRLGALEGGSTEGALARADALVALGRASTAVDVLLEAARAGGALGATAQNARARLFERAADLAHRHLADPERALAISAEALSWGGPWTGRTLLLFEQLALEKRRTELAHEVYARLVASAMGERGRRALSYRHARWLERRGEKVAALAMLVSAASEAGAGGAVATALERVARDVGDLDALARGYLALAAAAKHPVLRGGLVRRAVKVWEEETAHPEKAFDALFGQWAETFASELEPDLSRLANAVAEHDAAAGEAAYGKLFGEIERRAEDAWMGDEKARLLMKSARLHAARGAPDRAVALAREALGALEGEDPELAKTADVWVELARLELSRGEEAAARAALTSALALEPQHEGAVALADRLGVAPVLAPPRPASIAPTAPGIGAPVDVASFDDAPVAEAVAPRAPSGPPAAPRATSVPPAAAPRAPSARPAAPASDDLAASAVAAPAPDTEAVTSPATDTEAELDAIERSLDVEPLPLPLASRAPEGLAALPPRPSAPLVVPEALHDDADLPARASRALAWAPASSPPEPRAATLPPVARVNSLPPPSGETPEAFAERLAATPATRAGAAAVLRGLLMEDPGRFDVLVQLERVAEGTPELAAVQRVAGALVSLVDGHARPPAALALDLPAEPSRELLGRLTQVGGLTPVFSVLERLAESVPMYRQTLGQLGVLGTDRVAMHGTAPISRALAHVATLLPAGELPSVFLTSRPGGTPTVIRTLPGAVLLPVDWSRSEPELRFALARTAELARPRAMLLASLPTEDAATLFDAVRAAFGPADSGRVDKAAAQLASELWRSLPVRTQRDVRELVVQAGPSWDAAAARAAILSIATRVGLVAAGDVRSAVTGLFRCRSRGDIRFPEPSSWRARCAGDPELADLVRVALSDDFLAAVRTA